MIDVASLQRGSIGDARNYHSPVWLVLEEGSKDSVSANSLHTNTVSPSLLFRFTLQYYDLSLNTGVYCALCR
jgi:hypothetical protein